MNKKVKYAALAAALLLFFASTLALFFEIRYPVAYYGEIKDACKRHGLDEELIMSVIWTESKFDAQARSSAGAIGLMQLMPDTAKWCADMNGELFSTEMLTDGAYNIRLGTYYFKYLVDKFDDEKIALAAFNAGEGNVSRWLQDGGKIEFKETERYVNTVLKTKNIYKIKLKWLK